MRKLVGLILLLCLCVAAQNIAGKYAGDWASSGSGVGGPFRMSLVQSGGGQWKLDVSFGLGGQEVKTTTKSIKVDGAVLEAQYDFDIEGNALRSTIKGQLEGKDLKGTYKTTTVGENTPVDEGTWKAAQAK